MLQRWRTSAVEDVIADTRGPLPLPGSSYGSVVEEQGPPCCILRARRQEFLGFRKGHGPRRLVAGVVALSVAPPRELAGGRLAALLDDPACVIREALVRDSVENHRPHSLHPLTALSSGLPVHGQSDAIAGVPVGRLATSHGEIHRGWRSVAVGRRRHRAASQRQEPRCRGGPGPASEPPKSPLWLHLLHEPLIPSICSSKASDAHRDPRPCLCCGARFPAIVDGSNAAVGERCGLPFPCHGSQAFYALRIRSRNSRNVSRLILSCAAPRTHHHG